VALIAMLAATTILSQFFRSSLAVIAPELIVDLDLSPRMLGLANGAFFLALLVAQVYVGILFDRIGVRRTVTALAVFMVGGSALNAAAGSGEMLVAARFVTGIGSAASFMATVVLISAWFPRERWSTCLSWVFGLSQIGILLAGAPLAYVAERLGWRTGFAIAAAAAAVTGVLFLLLVRDRPPPAVSGQASEQAPPAAAGPVPGALEGLRLVLTLPGILPVFAMFTVAYGATVTFLALWAGPYLNDVHGLDAASRGAVLTAVGLVQAASVFLYGPLDRVFNSRKWVVLTGASITLGMLILLALLASPPLWLVLALLLVMAAACCFSPVLLAHMRSHFPDHLAGRGATTGNMGQLVGAGFLPILTGFIPGLFTAPGVGYAPEAYRAIFATLALALGIGTALYLRSRDAPPRG
jgi:MFS family permease